MSVATLPALRIERTFEATIDEVFAAWTRPDLLARWFAPGELQAQVELLEPRPGGGYRIAMEEAAAGKTHVIAGRFLELDPPHRLVLSWQWQEEGSYESRVTVELAQTDSHPPTTVLTLVHDGLRDAGAIEAHRHGWNGCLDKFPCRQ